jgi:hypothetical protein
VKGTTMIITHFDLAAVTAGVTQGPAGSREAQYRNLCLGDNAREQYDWMVAHMTPDGSEEPGVKQRVIKAIGNLCDWPVPD